jgi:hypothetical protein
MVANKIKLPKPNAATYRGWPFVIVAGVLLTVLALLDRGGLSEEVGRATDSTVCRVEVSAETLNVRAGPSTQAALLEVVARGTILDATRTVSDGFRELADGRWAADEFLTPLEGTSCL